MKLAIFSKHHVFAFSSTYKSAAFFSCHNKSKLAEFRKKTGYPLSFCKEALQKNQQDFDEAIKWAQAESVSRGLDKANKVAGRSMNQGLLGVLSDRKSAVIVEVNCETDFVARNAEFQNLDIREKNRCFFDNEKLKSLKYEFDQSTIDDLTALTVGNIGENILVRRAYSFFLQPNENARLSHYVHMSTAGMTQQLRDVKFGKYASVVKYSPLYEDKDASSAWHERAQLLSKQICQHIVGMNPYPSLNEQPRSNNPDSERNLKYQPFLLDESVLVGEHLKNNEMVLNDFIRVECGSEEEKETS